MRSLRNMALLLFLIAMNGFSQQVVSWRKTTDNYTYRDGVFWFKAKSDQVSLLVSMTDTGSYMRASVFVTGSSSTRLDLLPNQFTLETISPKLRELRYLPTQVLLGKVQRSLKWSRFGSAMAAASATQQQTTTSNTSGTVNVYGNGGSASGTYSGTTQSTTTMPDQERRAQIWERQQQREQAAYSTAHWLRKNTLKATTIEQPGQQYGGLVYFEREKACAKHGCELLLRMPIGNSIFEFPVRWSGRK